MSVLRTLIVAVWVVLAGFTSPVSAQPTQVSRVVVLRFTGWQADAARDMVAEEIAPFVELVDETRAVYAAQDLGVDVSTPEGMQQVVEHLGVSLVIAGSVEGRRRNASLQIIVVDSAGEELAVETGPSPMAANRAEIGEAALRAIENAQAALVAREAPPEPEPEPEPEPTVVAEEPEPEREPDVDEVGWRQPIFTGMAGLRIRSISARVDNETGGDAFLFTSDPYPEIDLLFVVRPLAAQNDLSRGLWLGVEGSFSAGISYFGEDGNARGMTSAHFRLDAGYGVVVEDLFELVGMVGYGLDAVLLDEANGYPSVLYSYLRPAVLGRIRALEDLFLVELGFGGRIGLDGGDLAAAYGPGLFFGGVDLFAGIGGIVAPGFTWAARFGFQHHVLTFDGAGGAMGNAASGSDEGFEARLLVGAAL